MKININVQLVELILTPLYEEALKKTKNAPMETTPDDAWDLYCSLLIQDVSLKSS